MNGIKISVIHGDAISVKADTLIMKFAQAPYGLDRDIIREFESLGNSIEDKLPKIWGYYFTESFKITNTESLLFIGTPPLRQFEYKEMREFGRKAMISLASSAPKTRSISMTIHGPGYGLDEIEAFESQIAGVVDSISSDDYPDNLQEILIIERSKGRAERLSNVLYGLFPDGIIPTPRSGGLKDMAKSSVETLRAAGYDSNSKKSIFVAMPFASDFDDSYHYGIYGAVNSAGFLCERADLQSFTGDVVEWVKNRISSADLVIADLTTANPNVYLEVGFAWGQRKKTILLIKDTNDLKFDTRGQRCLQYSSIKELEAKLKTELSNLKT
jgi:hypothetical protein